MNQFLVLYYVSLTAFISEIELADFPTADILVVKSSSISLLQLDIKTTSNAARVDNAFLNFISLDVY
ncbi:hypothetical protein ACM55I_06265 [Flavobacterium sp. GB2R13]|uniref:hypothetical protein n=1 Tax=Flavobacterium algoris TaxID=3398733 RepID=UPI003A89066D